MKNVKKVDIIDPYGFIYITTNMINGKKYIGQRIFNNKWDNYLGSGIHLKNSIKKYGRENFTKEIISIAYSNEELNELEILFITNHNAINNDDYYNIAYGGRSGSPFTGKHHSEETKNKISIMTTNYRTGRKLSEETKEKIRIAKKDLSFKGINKGRIVSDETKEKLRKINTGKKLSDETKQKLRESKQGENSWQAKLNDAKVMEIKLLLKEGKLKQYEIAKLFNVTSAAISAININKTWKHIILP